MDTFKLTSVAFDDVTKTWKIGDSGGKKSKYLGGKLKFKPFAIGLFSHSDDSYFEKLKITLLRSCTKMLDLPNLLNFFVV